MTLQRAQDLAIRAVMAARSAEYHEIQPDEEQSIASKAFAYQPLDSISVHRTARMFARDGVP